MYPSQQHRYPYPPPTYPGYPPPPSLQKHNIYPGCPPHPSQHRGPPAYSRHLPHSYAATEEMRIEAFADDYPGASVFQRPGGIYPIPAPPSIDEIIDYYRGTMPPPEYPSQIAAYPLVGILPPLGQYPGLQSFLQPPILQPPILQLPVYSIGHIYPPQYSPLLQSLYQPQQTADQHLLQYTEFPMALDSSCPGLLELPTKQNNESEATAASTIPSNTMSMAETTRKLDEILGKRAEERTEEEKKFREEHLAARQSVHARDATDRERRRQRNPISLASKYDAL
jgi:hypothetical protein